MAGAEMLCLLQGAREGESVRGGCMEMNAGESHEREMTEIRSAPLYSCLVYATPIGPTAGMWIEMRCDV